MSLPVDWLAVARGGSTEALGEALEACRAYLLAVAQRELDPALHAKGGASDLVQQTFLEAQRDFAGFQGQSDAEWRGWLRQMLLHNLASYTRRYRATAKRRFDREVPLDAGNASSSGPAVRAPTPTPSIQVMAREQAEALERALQRLPEEYRQVIALRYDEDRSFEEIGQLMNRSANAARKLWGRAIERLEEEMETTR